MGYQATTVTPAKSAPSAQAALPSTTILPRVASMRATRCGWRRSSAAACSNPARAAATLSVARLRLLPEDAADGGLDLGHLDVEQAGHHAHVGHVPEQLAEPGLAGDGLDHLVEGHRVEDEVGARRPRAPAARRRPPPRPGGSPATSSRAVSGFMATRRSTSFLRATYPSFDARIVYQVGRPAMFDGKRFLPDTGIPIWKSERRSTVLELCEPDPFAVATWRVTSLVIVTGLLTPPPPRRHRGRDDQRGATKSVCRLAPTVPPASKRRGLHHSQAVALDRGGRRHAHPFPLRRPAEHDVQVHRHEGEAAEGELPADAVGRVDHGDEPA